MSFLASIPSFLVNEILSVPAFLIGIITAVGLAAMRKSAGQVIGGAIKATLGFLLIGAGATLVVASLEPLGAMITGATGAQGVVPTNEAIVGIAQEHYGAMVAWIMILGFAVSLILARVTPLRYVFLTGHHVLFMATLVTIVFAAAGWTNWVVVVVGAVALGVLMVSLPALAHPFTRAVTGDDSIAIGHFGTAGYVASAAVGRAVGKNSRSTEDMKLPEGLRFLRDSMVSTALSMALMYIILAVVFVVRAGQDAAFTAFDGGASSLGNYLVQSFTQGLQFGVAVAVILFGVRTVLGELVPAFQGIAAKVVPGAIPALDCPIVFPYAQNAVLVGFIFSFIGGLIGLGVLSLWLHPAFGLALILPGLVPHFFTGGAAGVYGNATGGRRGAALGALTNGLLITFLPSLLLQVLGEFSSENTTFGDADFGWFGIIIGRIAGLGTGFGAILTIVVCAIILGGAFVVQRRYVNGRPLNPDPLNPTQSERPGDAATTKGADGHAQESDNRYPLIEPPAGAPQPPSREWVGSAG